MAENHVAAHSNQANIARILMSANQNSFHQIGVLSVVKPITNNTQQQLIMACCVGEACSIGQQKLK